MQIHTINKHNFKQFLVGELLLSLERTQIWFSTPIRPFSTIHNPVMGIQPCPLTCRGTRYTHDTHAYMQANTRLHKTKLNLNKKKILNPSFFSDRVSLRSLGWPGTCYTEQAQIGPPAFSSQRPKVYTTKASSKKCLWKKEKKNESCRDMG